MDEKTAVVATESSTLIAPAPMLVDPTTTDETLVELWLKGKAAHTVRAYQGDLHGLQRFLGHKPLREITLDDLYRFSDQLETQSADASTIVRRMSGIKSLFSFGAKVRYLPLNVGAAYTLPKVQDQLAERILTEEQVQKMLALTTRPRDHALLRLLYGAGLRVSEVVSLTWSRIHEREGGRAQLTIHGKGQKTRHVLISAATREELQRLRGDTPAEAPIFTSRGEDASTTVVAHSPIDKSG